MIKPYSITVKLLRYDDTDTQKHTQQGNEADASVYQV